MADEEKKKKEEEKAEEAEIRIRKKMCREREREREGKKQKQRLVWWRKLLSGTVHIVYSPKVAGASGWSEEDLTSETFVCGICVSELNMLAVD